VKDGTVVPLYYDPHYDGTNFLVPTVLKGSPVLSFPEFYRKVRGGEPSGARWDAYRTNLAVDGAMLRTIAMPPGSPAAAATALRAALARLNDDKEYAEEALKTIHTVPHYETGDGVNGRVRKALTVPPEIRTFVLGYMKGSGGK
jgi:hypothetical protein